MATWIWILIVVLALVVGLVGGFYGARKYMEKYLKENPEFFRVILDKYFIQNPYSKIVISGNGNKSPEYDDTLSLSSEEIEKIKNDTENFNNWVDEPDSPEVIAGIPSLTLDEVKKFKI